MKFAILTTTHKRPELLLRAIKSVQSQTYNDYTHYIVNDSPDCKYGETINSTIENDARIIYTTNAVNLGKNTSLNKVLNKLTADNFDGYIVYLDDDDWLASDCLENFKKNIEKYKAYSWFVSNRVLDTGESLTRNNTRRKGISYFFDYLLFKTFSGDATHCINFSACNSARFPSTIKNGEEWYYFLHVSKKCRDFLYIAEAGTYTEGYSINGQNAAMQSVYSYNTITLFKEKQTMTSLVYLSMRAVRVLFTKRKKFNI
jgi:glycosyltransferase involved in cell wall biosynthesis